jgi:hypothetical protein
VLRCAFWNPLGVRVRASGMQPYLQNELPTSLGDAVAALLPGDGHREP